MSVRISRRALLEGFGAMGAAAAAARLLPGGALAQGSPDYRALVCVFLYGGNDGNNLVVPVEDAEYAAYASLREPGPDGLALPREQLLPLAPASGAARFGLHPSLPELQSLWDLGSLGVLFNVGTLVQPVSKQDLAAGAPVPESLLSHADQQHQWQSAVADRSSRTGWGGRIADGLPAAPVPSLISVAGNSLFGTGATTSALSVPSAGGSFLLAGFDGSPQSAARRLAFDQLRGFDLGSTLLRATGLQISGALSASALVNPLLTTASPVDALFANQTSSIAGQLWQVARLIGGRASLGGNRQIFFVSLGGFDTHNDQLDRQANLFGMLSPALKAFYDATVQLGVADSVTTFTLSDFARTLKPASGGGSDHAWGNHHLVLGGAVRGRQTFGTFPSLELAGPDDASDEGRWIPTTSVDQYAATLARWFGVPATDLPRVLPGLAGFPTSDLGFFG